jgi:hypothetical protein
MSEHNSIQKAYIKKKQKKGMQWNRDCSLTIQEDKESIRIFLSDLLGVRLDNDKQVNHWLEKYSSLKERGLIR